MANSLSVIAPREFLGLPERLDPDDIGPYEMEIRQRLESLFPEEARTIWLKPDTVAVDIDGAADPDGMARAAASWNESILVLASDAVRRFLADPKLDGTLSYMARCALQDADNHFAVGTSHAVVVRDERGWACLKVLLDDGTAERIKADPGEWACLSVAYDFGC